MRGLERSVGLLEAELGRIGVVQNPVIVLGMHRSGTTMLVKVLNCAGVFMGSRLSGNLEPRVFQDANRQILDYFDASWLNVSSVPQPRAFYTGFAGLAAEIADRLRDELAARYFDDLPVGGPGWGFKDPRTCLTAALFLRIFPRARALYIFRDPLDVAKSIVAREERQRGKYPRGMRVELSTHEELMWRAVKAWETYNRFALETLDLFQEYAVVRYESVAASPLNLLPPALAALGLEVSTTSISGLGIAPPVRDDSGSEIAPSDALRDYIAELDVSQKLRRYMQQ